MATKKAVTVENTVETVVEKKAPAKRTASKKVKCEIQFAGKSYTQDDLVKIAKDVWIYDLGQKASALKNMPLSSRFTNLAFSKVIVAVVLLT